MINLTFLLGTSRSDGNTRLVIDRLNQGHDAPVIDLNDKELSYFDYDHQNCDDQLLDIVDRLIDSSTIVFATPVYWYSMSAQMKIFFDRTSDLITIRKDKGRALAGRKTYLVSTGTEETLPEGFEVPFKRTSEYFDMQYGGCLYLKVPEELEIPQEDSTKFSDFSDKIFGL